MTRFARSAGLASGLLITATALGGTQVWTFDESTTGEDINWMSPTSVDPNAAFYDTVTEITGVFVTVSLGGLPLGPFDFIDDVPPELQTSEQTVEGPAPVIFSQDSIVFPEPPEDPAITLDLLAGLDRNGFGTLTATNVVFGSIEVDLGFPFGVQTVDIEEVRLTGSITVTPIFVACPEDTDTSGSVDVDDLVNVILAWGTDGAATNADVNGSGLVDVDDIVAVILAWGLCG